MTDTEGRARNPGHRSSPGEAARSAALVLLALGGGLVLVGGGLVLDRAVVGHVGALGARVGGRVDAGLGLTAVLLVAGGHLGLGRGLGVGIGAAPLLGRGHGALLALGVHAHGRAGGVGLTLLGDERVGPALHDVTLGGVDVVGRPVGLVGRHDQVRVLGLPGAEQGDAVVDGLHVAGRGHAVAGHPVAVALEGAEGVAVAGIEGPLRGVGALQVVALDG